MPDEPTPDEQSSSVHRVVLNALQGLCVTYQGEECALKVEKSGGRLDLPNAAFSRSQKEPGQRKKSLCYTDAVLPIGSLPRVLIEVVDSSPSDPNGITGLTINADRVASFYGSRLDLLFVVLTDMKAFYCSECARGHYIDGAHAAHLTASWAATTECRDELLHEGVAVQFRKALKDYPIKDYLKAIQPPIVLFLNRSKIETAWATYQPAALAMVRDQISRCLLENNRDETQFEGIDELVPAAQKHLLVPQ